MVARPKVSGVSWSLNTQPISPELLSPDTPFTLSLPADPKLAGDNIACNASNTVGSAGQAIKIRMSGHNFLVKEILEN